MSDRRKLGENDPGRYEISVLIGPCSLAEAMRLREDLEDLADATAGDLGAAFNITTWDEDAS